MSLERRHQILRYLLLGVVTALGYGLLSWYWLRAVGWVVGQEIIFSSQPPAARILQRALDAVPWLIGAILLIWGIVRRRVIPVVAYAGGFGLVIATLLAWMFLTPVVSDYASRIPFDATTWRSENTEQPRGLRVRMVDDLLRRHPLLGMRRADVDALLGVPPKTSYFADYEYVYWLGPERGFMSIDSEWLALRFRDDRVVEARIVRD
jgi:hypothetical protein